MDQDGRDQILVNQSSTKVEISEPDIDQDGRDQISVNQPSTNVVEIMLTVYQPSTKMAEIKFQ